MAEKVENHRNPKIPPKMAAAEQPQLRNLFDRPLNLKHMPNPQSIYTAWSIPIQH